MKDITPKAYRCSLGACPAILEVTPQDMRCGETLTCPSLFEVTPEAMRCAIGASCPAVFEVTPDAMRCKYTVCPAIFEVTPEAMQRGKMNCLAIYEQQDGHIIIGKAMKEIPEEVAKRIGPDEFAVWVPRGLVKPGDDHGRGPVPETIAPAAQIQGLADETSG